MRLDLVVRAFNRGATAEEIVQKFPSLELSDVYQVIGYYLKYKAELGEFVYSENIGAYSAASSPYFNGFAPAKVVHVNQ